MIFSITSKNVDITQKHDKGRVWKQIALSIVASLPFFTHGVETNALSSSAHAGHFIRTPDDVPLSTTIMIIGAVFSPPIFCYFIDQFGRKTGIYCINLVQGASCVPLFLLRTELNVTILHLLAGISSGGLFTVLPVYVKEITENSHREVTLALMMLMICLGYLIRLVMSVETMMYLILAMVGVQLLSLYFLVETPSYLVKIKKYQNAREIIGRLKCVDENHPAVLEEFITLKDESDRATANGRLTIFKILNNVIWRDGMKIGICMYTTITLCGSIAFLDQDKALSQLKMDSDSESYLVLYCMCAGSVLCITLIRFMERKYLLTMAYTIMVLSMGLLAVYTQANLTVSTSRWLPVVALAVLVVGYGVAWGLPNIIMVEMFNLEIRATLLGILYTYYQIIKLVHVHTFPYIEDYVGIYTVFYVFAVVNLYGVVYTMFAVPNVKNKSVKQIEKQLKRVPLLTFKHFASKKIVV